VHRVAPRTNVAYWEPKVRRNMQRDREQSAALERLGWLVIRVWEHDDPADAAERIASEWRVRSAKMSGGGRYEETKNAGLLHGRRCPE